MWNMTFSKSASTGIGKVTIAYSIASDVHIDVRSSIQGITGYMIEDILYNVCAIHVAWPPRIASHYESNSVRMVEGLNVAIF